MVLVSHILLKERVPMKLIIHVIQVETYVSRRTMSSLATAYLSLYDVSSICQAMRELPVMQLYHPIRSSLPGCVTFAVILNHTVNHAVPNQISLS